VIFSWRLISKNAVPEIGPFVPKCLASDGDFLYMHTSKGLLKIGSGYRCTTAGAIAFYNNEFFPDETGWLGFSNVTYTNKNRDFMEGVEFKYFLLFRDDCISSAPPSAPSC